MILIYLMQFMSHFSYKSFNVHNDSLLNYPISQDDSVFLDGHVIRVEADS